MKNTKRNRLPTTVELFQGKRSDIARSAIFRSGAGKHADKRAKKAKKGNWKNEDW